MKKEHGTSTLPLDFPEHVSRERFSEVEVGSLQNGKGKTRQDNNAEFSDENA